jgi:16S rRNA (cytosine1402-N4)-methyltransferase
MTSPHLSVLLEEVVAAIAPAPGRHVVDGTFGAGGYTRAFLAAGARVTAFDRDPSAARFAEGQCDGFELVCAPFSTPADVLGDASVDGVALDLGVSSMQLDEAERGLSFMRDGPLDMRMGDQGPTAADIVNTWDHGPLAHIFKLYGEERQSGRVATAILRRRAEQPFTRTLDLAEVVEKALGGRRGFHAPAPTRSR